MPDTGAVLEIFKKTCPQEAHFCSEVKYVFYLLKFNINININIFVTWNIGKGITI